ncbi:MAG: tRNA epoxyqueuosine(34) reductase QueG [Verrucomicrobia bacterium]|nr:tRNA epoxyqueuosine(34) reductase QueG [Verrucomicrobiota bacterium]
MAPGTTASNIKAAVRRCAAELGFDLCGFTTADVLERAPLFLRWLAEGYQGGMAYLARNAQRRIDPQAVLPGAKSAIALAVSYADESRRDSAFDASERGRPTLESRESGVTGLVARYARFEDYHAVIGTRLEVLIDFVNKLGGAGTESIGYVDSGPVLERDLAWRAGLGFVGKHTNLIGRMLGNWFFIAEIITTIEVEPDTPEPNRCGRCRRCIDACPTGAIVAPFKLDARRCISYLTIELRGSIPTDLRPLIGDKIFGCDVCLEACPWNRFAKCGGLMSRHRWCRDGRLDLIKVLCLDESEFRACFGNTPIARAKLAGLKRNACVALGNTGDARSLPALEKLIMDSNDVVSEHARWAVERIRQRM